MIETLIFYELHGQVIISRADEETIAAFVQNGSSINFFFVDVELDRSHESELGSIRERLRRINEERRAELNPEQKEDDNE